MKRPKSPHYHPIFKEANGPGPWSCYECQKPVLPGRLTIHHLDEDPFNNDPSNLVAMHRGCHNSLHKRGVPFTAEHRANMATSRIGFRHTPEAKAKIGAARRGKTMSAETRAKISASTIGRKRAPYSDAWKAFLSESRKGKSQTHKRFRCEECELVSSGGGIYQHQKATGHEGKILL